jgi:hypothetical protein
MPLTHASRLSASGWTAFRCVLRNPVISPADFLLLFRNNACFPALRVGHGFSVNVIQFKTSRGQVVFSVFVF